MLYLTINLFSIGERIHNINSAEFMGKITTLNEKNFIINWISESWLPWISALATVIIFFITVDTLKKTIIEAATPFAFNRLYEIKKCVFICSTPEQYINYINKETSCSSRDDLLELLILAKKILNKNKLNILERTINSISDEIPQNNK
jgi:choline-glycine betaine transporter